MYMEISKNAELFLKALEDLRWLSKYSLEVHMYG